MREVPTPKWPPVRGRLWLLEAERLRLCNELHNDTVQRLVGVNLQLQVCAMRLDQGALGDLGRDLRVAQGELAETLTDLGRVIARLRSPILEGCEFFPALQDMAQELSECFDLPVVCRTPRAGPQVPAAVGAAALRVVQECVRGVPLPATSPLRIHIAARQKMLLGTVTHRRGRLPDLQWIHAVVRVMDGTLQVKDLRRGWGLEFRLPLEPDP